LVGQPAGLHNPTYANFPAGKLRSERISLIVRACKFALAKANIVPPSPSLEGLKGELAALLDVKKLGTTINP